MMGLASMGTQSAEQRRRHIVQGEQCVSECPDTVLSTLLGSCVAACMWDPMAGVGGMNHFLLPGDNSQNGSGDSVRHGVHAMELLVNALLLHGARRERLQAKLFGGANLMLGLTDVGAMNAAFAENFLEREGIRHCGGSLRGRQGRRIQFWPVSGRARQVLLAAEERTAFDGERRAPAPASTAFGDLEMF